MCVRGHASERVSVSTVVGAWGCRVYRPWWPPTRTTGTGHQLTRRVSLIASSRLAMISQVHSSSSLSGVQTEVSILNYADRVLVLVTQLGKVGHMVRNFLVTSRKTVNKMQQFQDSSVDSLDSVIAPASIHGQRAASHPAPSFHRFDIDIRQCPFGASHDTSLTLCIPHFLTRLDDNCALRRRDRWATGRNSRPRAPKMARRRWE